MSVGRGNPLYIYEKCLSEGSFVSARLKFLDLSGIRYKGNFQR